ncbi:MAG: periplasmic heavy metal sensor, partial [Hyphomonadaceae bacterium]
MSERAFPWRTALYVSLAANLLVIGAVVGAYAAGLRLEKPGPRFEMAHGGGPGRGGFMRALPEAEREAIRAELRRSFEETRALREALRTARENVLTAASAETYDPAQMNAALAELRAADGALQTAWQTTVAETMGRLSADQRRAAIGAFVLERGPRMRMHRRGRDGGGEPPPEDDAPPP